MTSKRIERINAKFKEDFEEYKQLQRRTARAKGSTNKKELADFTKRINKQLNQRFYRLEKQGIEKSSQAYQYAKKEGQTRYTVSEKKLMGMTTPELLEMAKNSLQKLATTTSTKSGIDLAEQKRIEMSANALDEILFYDNTVDKSEVKKTWKEAVENSKIYETFNNEWVPSDAVIELWYNHVYKGNVSEESFIQFMKDSQKTSTPPHILERKLKAKGIKALKR